MSILKEQNTSKKLYYNLRTKSPWTKEVDKVWQLRRSINSDILIHYRDEKGEDKEEEKMQEALNSAIVKEKPNVKWTDVAGLDQAKASL